MLGAWLLWVTRGGFYCELLEQVCRGWHWEMDGKRILVIFRRLRHQLGFLHPRSKNDNIAVPRKSRRGMPAPRIATRRLAVHEHERAELSGRSHIAHTSATTHLSNTKPSKTSALTMETKKKESRSYLLILPITLFKISTLKSRFTACSPPFLGSSCPKWR